MRVTRRNNIIYINGIAALTYVEYKSRDARRQGGTHKLVLVSKVCHGSWTLITPSKYDGVQMSRRVKDILENTKLGKKIQKKLVKHAGEGIAA